MKRNTIRLTESDLHNIIKESVKKVLSEDKNDDVLKQRQMQHMWDNQIYNGKRPDLNSKRSKERFDWNDKHEGNRPIDIPDTDDGENAAKEFFNRPNAATDFKHFPRMSKYKETNFDTLKNGSEKIRALKRKREIEKERQRENMIFNKRREAKNILQSIGWRVIKSGYKLSSIKKKDIKIINSIIKDNEFYNGEVFPEFVIDDRKGIWFLLLMNFMNKYMSYNPYKANMLAYELGFIDNMPTNKELDIDLDGYENTNYLDD
jgi:hypothetical protein